MFSRTHTALDGGFLIGLVGAIRNEDLAARVGGDEMVVLLTGINTLAEAHRIGDPRSDQNELILRQASAREERETRSWATASLIRLDVVRR